jgi:stage IV sporulation protein B
MKKYTKKGFWSIALRSLLCAVMMLTLCVGVLYVSASAAEATKYDNMMLIPGGIPFGVRFSTEGVVIVGFCDFNGMQRTKNPAYAAGLRPKDVIKEINGKAVSDAEELTRIVEDSGGATLKVTYTRGSVSKYASISPIFSESDGKYKTGIWVRDSGAGIGTITFIDPITCEFAGLGHGICDGETGELVPMHRGVVTDVKISSVKKGVSGVPGEIKGYFCSEKKGTLMGNTDCGVYGVLEKIPQGLGEAIHVCKKEEICEGKAKLLCTFEDGQRREYGIEICNINRGATGSKCFIVKITDPELIEKTGGIVQGMSGSPIIQNGKLVGAVTHVMINDPCVGYGIFIENMLNAAQMPMAKAS